MDHHKTDAGIELKAVYGDEDVRDSSERPGEFPYTRGVYADMYRGKLWTTRQYAGFGTAKESNQRYRYLLEHGQTGLSVAFDLPTQMGLDPDDPRARGEVGRTGVSIASLRDMEMLLEEIPLERVSTSMTINATAAILLSLYVAVADQRGISRDHLQGTIQNDILKEYIARGTYIYPPQPSMRLITDTFAFCKTAVPKWNTISISGYHIREAGADAVQEVAFTLANGIAYVEAAVTAGLDVDDFAPRLSFFFNVHNHLLEEIAKFRAARRLWAEIMRDRFAAKDPRSLALRFHAQTAGATLTAQQPLNNVARVTIQALAAVLGGAQSLHCNAYDEALALPTEESARIALRTQQVLSHESGIAAVADPTGGAWAIESLTQEIARRARDYVQHIDAMGGTIRAIEAGYVQREIQRQAFAYQKAVDDRNKVVVGVNRFRGTECDSPSLHRASPQTESDQIARIRQLRASRDPGPHGHALERLRQTALHGGNLVAAILDATKALATVGEISAVLRDVFGQYRDPAWV